MGGTFETGVDFSRWEAVNCGPHFSQMGARDLALGQGCST